MTTIIASDPAAVAPRPASDSVELAAPLTLGPRTMRNRIAMAPASVCYANEDGTITEQMVDHYRRRSVGGAGMVITENLAVSTAGRQLPRQALISDESQLPRLTALARGIQEPGALAVVQVVHAGRYAGPWERYRMERRLAASAVPFELLAGRWETPQEMTRAEIEEVVADFARAAGLARRAGFDGIEIHAAQGMLLSSFQSPLLNLRADDYGRDRNRLAREVAAAVVAAAGPDMVVGWHLFSDERMPGGLQPEEAIRHAVEIERTGVHFFTPIPTTFESLRLAKAAAPEVDPTAHDASVVQRLAEALTTAVVFANGGIATGEAAREALRGGHAQAVAVARAMLADPDWAAHVLRDEPVRFCACTPATCLRTQLQGSICGSWPAAVQERGYWGTEAH